MDAKEIGYTEQMQKAAQAAAAGTSDDFWKDVEAHLSEIDKADRGRVEKRPGE